MTEEGEVQSAILKYCIGARLFRNNTGAIRAHGRMVHYGLCKGSSDIIGWVPRKITKRDVGKTVALFVALEVKAGSRLTDEQVEFLDDVISDGGIGAVVHSVEEAQKALEE